MASRTKPSSNTPRAWTFDTLFEGAAWRVLRRNGMPDHLIPAEIERLRHVDPGFKLPTIEELERDSEFRGSR